MVAKFVLVRTYTFEVHDLKGQLDEILVSGLGIVWSEEAWNQRVEEGDEEGTWEDHRAANEKDFYVAYPKDKVGVTFPPSTVEDLARIQAWDLHMGEVSVSDVFGGDAEDEWWVKEDGKTAREIELEFE